MKSLGEPKESATSPSSLPPALCPAAGLTFYSFCSFPPFCGIHWERNVAVKKALKAVPSGAEAIECCFSRSDRRFDICLGSGWSWEISLREEELPSSVDLEEGLFVVFNLVLFLWAEILRMEGCCACWKAWQLPLCIGLRMKDVPEAAPGPSLCPLWAWQSWCLAQVGLCWRCRAAEPLGTHCCALGSWLCPGLSCGAAVIIHCCSRTRHLWPCHGLGFALCHRALLKQ